MLTSVASGHSETEIAHLKRQIKHAPATQNDLAFQHKFSNFKFQLTITTTINDSIQHDVSIQQGVVR